LPVPLIGETADLYSIDGFNLSGWADLNRRPPRPKRGALPTALHPEQAEYNLNLGASSMDKFRLTDICRKEPKLGRNLATLWLLTLWLAAGCAPVSEEPAITPTRQPTRTPTVEIRTPSPTPETTSTPEPAQTRTIECSPASLASGTVGVGMMDKPMDYLVLLPACYAEDDQKRYPVLYLIHGLNADQSQWLDLGIDQAAEQMMQKGEIPPFLIVLPFDHSFKQPGEYRYEEVFLEHLIPQIDSDYRTQSSRQARAIGGLSRGGAWAIYLASRNPETFSIVGAHSPVVFASTGGALTLLLRDMRPKSRPTFYVDAGDKDIDFRGIQAFTKLLDSYGYPHEWRQNVGYHDETYWRAHIEEYLRWYGSQFSLNESKR
jgi:enterochelin esterase-like enzyme